MWFTYYLVAVQQICRCLLDEQINTRVILNVDFFVTCLLYELPWIVVAAAVVAAAVLSSAVVSAAVASAAGISSLVVPSVM